MILRHIAASFVLSNDDIAAAVKLLDNAPTQEIPEGVEVWCKFENDSFDEIINHIDYLEEKLKAAYEQGKVDSLALVLSKPSFINGFDSWYKTYYEVVRFLVSNKTLVKSNDKTNGLKNLARDITDKFEAKYSCVEWDKNWQTTLKKFIKNYLHLNDGLI